MRHAALCARCNDGLAIHHSSRFTNDTMQLTLTFTPGFKQFIHLSRHCVPDRVPTYDQCHTNRKATLFSFGLQYRGRYSGPLCAESSDCSSQAHVLVTFPLAKATALLRL